MQIMPLHSRADPYERYYDITPRLGLHHQSGRIWKGRGQGSTLGLVLVARPKANELSAEADAPEFDRGRGEMRQGRDAPGFDRGTARTAPRRWQRLARAVGLFSFASFAAL
jgi:hypothetical protein